MQNAQGITYLHGDHLGSTSVTSGATSSTQVYYPFGAVRASTGTLPTDFTFTGQKFDASDGLMYYGARYYDAALGRFISADTITPNLYNPQALNRYAYVLNNPLKYIDPTGHAQTCGQGEVCGDGGTGNVDPPAVTQGEQNPSGGGYPSGDGSSSGCSNCQSRPAPPSQPNPVSLDRGIGDLVCKVARALGMDAGCGGRKVGPPGGGGTGGVGKGPRVVEPGEIEGGSSPQKAPYYPPNRGFAGEPNRTTLESGTIVDRYGSPEGSFASPRGTPLGQRSLPPGAENQPLNAYEVIKPLEVDAGRTAPWFDQPGGGMQYDFGRSIQELIDAGYLAPLR